MKGFSYKGKDTVGSEHTHEKKEFKKGLIK